MSNNLIKRIITSIFLLFLFLFINFSNQYIFLFSILILGVSICVEFNNIFSKLPLPYSLKKTSFIKKFNLKFLILNLTTFCYIFLIFCNFSYQIHLKNGPTFFFYVACVCFFTDIGGYIFGKIIGGKKLTKISPNKTLSGSIGSFLFSLIPLVLCINFSYMNFEFNHKQILFALLLSLVSQLGDLFISFIKRKANIKDTGKILPGHGGILDRLDGFIFAMPLSYFLLKLI